MNKERVLYGDRFLMLVICGIIFAVINKKTVKINYLFLVFCVLRMFLKRTLKVMTGCIAVFLFKKSAVLFFNLSAVLLSFHEFLTASFIYLNVEKLCWEFFLISICESDYYLKVKRVCVRNILFNCFRKTVVPFDSVGL